MQLEGATKKRRGGRPSQTSTPQPPWLQRALEIFASIDSSPPVNRPVVPPTTMTLRGRQKAAAAPPDRSATDEGQIEKENQGNGQDKDLSGSDVGVMKPESSTSSSGSGASKKLPRVILKLGQDPREASAS